MRLRQHYNGITLSEGHGGRSMQALQRLIENIAVQMKVLKGTARLLIAALMVIAALSLFLVAQITGQPGMLPLPMDLS